MGGGGDPGFPSAETSGPGQRSSTYGRFGSVGRGGDTRQEAASVCVETLPGGAGGTRASVLQAAGATGRRRLPAARTLVSGRCAQVQEGGPPPLEPSPPSGSLRAGSRSARTPFFPAVTSAAGTEQARRGQVAGHVIWNAALCAPSPPRPHADDHQGRPESLVLHAGFAFRPSSAGSPSPVPWSTPPPALRVALQAPTSPSAGSLAPSSSQRTRFLPPHAAHRAMWPGLPVWVLSGPVWA